MKTGRTVRVGCRNTPLGRARTTHVIGRLKEQHPDHTFEIVDLPPDTDAAALLDALAAGVCDLQVRSARELPVDLPEGVTIAAYARRIDPFDVLVTRDGALLEELPAGSVLAVDSARVKVQVARLRTDLEIRQIASAADRHWQALEKGEISGFIAAAEDVEALGRQAAVAEVFPPDTLLPAAGQGSLAILARAGDGTGVGLGRTLDDGVTRGIVEAERAFLRELHVEPAHPVAVHGHFDEGVLVLEALLADEVSGAVLRDDLDGTPEEGADLGIRLAKLVLADGARDYLAGYR